MPARNDAGRARPSYGCFIGGIAVILVIVYIAQTALVALRLRPAAH